MSRLPLPPDLQWKDDGTPVATRFDDVYYSMSDGLEETRSVFLKACGLPERWRDTRHFTTGELGFGTGLNFLGLVACWLASERRPDGWLHFISVEKHPLFQEDAAKALARWPELKPLSDLLVANWPDRSFGMQRRVFPEWRVTLTLDIGEAETALSGWDASIDAWFLDGFAPAKNEDMWSAAIYGQMARLSAPGCIVGTYTVAGAVRRGLAEAGFDVSKKPGFGRKRERLEAIWPETSLKPQISDPYLIRPETVTPKQLVVIGAGIAGACVARVFAERGLQVDVLDAEDQVASGASGNPLGLVMPRLDAAETAQARVLRLSYLHAVRFYKAFAAYAVDPLETRQTAQSDAEFQRFAKLAEDPPLGPEWLAFEEGHSDVLLHKQSLMIRPVQLVESLLQNDRITVHTGRRTDNLKTLRSDYPDGTVFVLATGGGVKVLAPEAYMPLVGKMGQIDYTDHAEAASEPEAIASGTYALRKGSALLFGATFETLKTDEVPYVSEAAQNENLKALGLLSPDWRALVDTDILKSRAGVRATTPDRLPVAGLIISETELAETLKPLGSGAEVTRQPEYDPFVYCLTGLGSRGFSFAPLMAEVIASMALGEPLPLARPELEQIVPNRFLVRVIRKGQYQWSSDQP